MTVWEMALRRWEAFRKQALEYRTAVLQDREDRRLSTEWFRRSRSSTTLSLDQEARLIIEECAERNSVTPVQPHLAIVTSLSSAADLTVVRQKLNEFASRHRALRTAFEPVDNQADRRHSPQLFGRNQSPRRLRCTDPGDTAPVPVTEIDIDTNDCSVVGPTTFSLIRAEALKPFQLDKPPLLRAIVVRNSTGERLFALVADRLVADWWSMEAAVAAIHEIDPLVSCRMNAEPAPRTPSGKRALADLQVASIAYLRDQWSTTIPLSAYDLPWTLPDTLLDTSVNCQTLHISQVLTSRLKRGSTPSDDDSLSSVVLAALALALHHASQKVNISIWTDFRSPSLPECAGAFGPFSHTHIVTVDLSLPLSQPHLLRQVRESLSRSHSHSHIPLELVWFAMRYSPLRSAIGHVSFQYSRCNVLDHSAGGIGSIASAAFETGPRCALQFWVCEHGDDLSITLTYDTGKYESDAAGTLLTDLLTILEEWSSIDITRGLDDAHANTGRLCDGDPHSCLLCITRDARRSEQRSAKATLRLAETRREGPEMTSQEAGLSC